MEKGKEFEMQINKVFDLLTKDCSDCAYYNTDRKDQPCCSCVNKVNFKKKGVV